MKLSKTEKPSKKQLDKFITQYEDQLSPEELQEKIKKLIEFFEENEKSIDYTKFTPEFLQSRKAYPNNDHYINIPGQHNVQKWLNAVKDIYYNEKKGNISRVNAIRQATNGWNIMETYDFLNWLRFYEEGAHLKYKTAQVWYENGAPGYFLHVKPDPVEEESKVNDQNFDKDVESEQLSVSEKKKIIEKQRAKIIGRLDSAEKLLRSDEGQLFAGDELEALMESIFNLKKKIQLVNKLSTATRIYEDMIVREANILGKNGFAKSANLLYSVADGGPMPPPAPPAPPAEGSGSAGGLPAASPATPPANVSVTSPPSNAPNTPPLGEDISGAAPINPTEKKPEDSALNKFKEGLKTLNVTDDELSIEDDNLEVEDDI